MQLARYLASVWNELEKNEIMDFKNTPIWPKENLGGRFIARYLYIPLPTYREFALPIIDWRRGWTRNAPEGIYMYFFLY